MTLSELTEENRELTEGDDYLNVLAIKDLLKNKKLRRHCSCLNIRLILWKNLKNCKYLAGM
jgi:hypothetical protein